MIKRYTSDPRFVTLFGAILVLILFLGLVSNLNYDSSVGRYLLHSWRSLKKFPNIVYAPLVFKKSDLPEYRLVINADNWKILEDNLPIDNNLTHSQLSEDNKSYVESYFMDPKSGYEAEVDIRYRGLMSNNWEAEKKSLRIKFPKDNLFQGMRSLNLIIPEDRGYFLEPLSIYRAQKIGLLSPELKFVRVYINNRDFGVYLASEAWSSEFLAKNNTIDTNNIFSNKDEMGVDIDNIPAFSNWKSYTAEIEEGVFEELEVLNKLTNEADDEQFDRMIGALVDLEKIYKWEMVNILAGSDHQSYFSNFVLIFRKETGKFEPIPWNVEFKTMDDKLFSDNLPLLVRRILNNKKRSDELVAMLNGYLTESNLKDDLAYYDELYKKTKYDFYKDNAKNQSNIAFDREVKHGLGLITDNFEKAKILASQEGARNINIWEKKNYSKVYDFPGSFKYFNGVFLNIDTFLASNPQFYKRDSGTIVLGSGSHIFTRTVIVPRGLKLIIEPGATLLFYPKVSLISYSPVSAVGSAFNPIIMKPLFAGESNAWGSFGVVTDSGKNHLRFVRVSGGSADLINGVEFLSQTDIRNSVSTIENSVFSGARSDDGLHVILGSVDLKNNLFKNNFSDSVDLDYVLNSQVVGNTFLNFVTGGSNGDGLDLSGAVNIKIFSNQISNHGDKCISVGEQSIDIRIEKNTLNNCGIGIAVKDNSVTEIVANKITGNKTAGISLYRKKQEFIKGGVARIVDSILENNNKEIEKDEFSEIIQ